jgi:hypothetical protein
MKKLKKFVAAATLLAISTASINEVEGQYYSDTGGYGYEESSMSPALTPSIALGTVALVAIIAVAIRHGSRGHSHGHAH